MPFMSGETGFTVIVTSLFAAWARGRYSKTRPELAAMATLRFSKPMNDVNDLSTCTVAYRAYQ
jgi:hypothetical protein